jgi:hypothetical protein
MAESLARLACLSFDFSSITTLWWSFSEMCCGICGGGGFNGMGVLIGVGSFSGWERYDFFNALGSLSMRIYVVDGCEEDE